MWESIFNATVTDTTMTIGVIFSTIVSAFVLGLGVGITYLKTTAKEEISKDFFITIVVLPVLMSSIILLIGNNVAGAFSLAGIFSVIRFRSAPGTTKDILYILFCVGVGLACGMEVPGYAFILAVCMCMGMVLLSLFTTKVMRGETVVLKITIPENLNIVEVFDDLLGQYTANYKLVFVRTKDLGSVYEIGYKIQMKERTNTKEFIDLLRCRNGNLPIQLLMGEFINTK